MILNGKKITKQEELEMYKVQLVDLKKQVMTESIYNDIVHISKMIRLTETPLKFTELTKKQNNVRSQFEFDKIQKQLNKLNQTFTNEFKTSIEDYIWKSKIK
tara:strand:+ start:4857 stop:5162 length:306 start_codon:yes stop_codon:yes gene_type:complete